MNRQRVVFIINNIYPNGLASSARLRQYGKGLRTHGADMLVIMPQPRIKPNQVNINPEGSGQDQYGVVYRCMTGSQQRNSNIFFRQFIDFWGNLYTWLFLFFNLKKSTDTVVIYEGKSFWQYLVIRCCKLRGVKVGLELNELPFVAEGDTSSAQQNRIKYYKKVLRQFDFAICISQALVDLVKEYAPATATIKVPILCESATSQFPSIDVQRPYIFHSGSLSERKDGICGMMRAFGIATKKATQPIDLYLTGKLENSPHADELRTIIREYAIEDRVHFLGYLDTNTLCAYQSRCFCAIINKYDTLQNAYCFPTKLSEYLLFSRPIITTNIGEANAFLHNGINAFIVLPHKPELIADKIVYILNHPAEAQKIGQKGYMLTQKELSCEYNAQRILEFIENLRNINH